MKFRTAAIAVALVSLTVTWESASAAPMLWRLNPIWKNQLISSQQEDEPSVPDKEIATTYCRLLFKLFKGSLSFIEGSVDDYCKDVEVGPEPAPEEKADTLAKLYELVLDMLKKINLNELLVGLNG